jgi:hypothetical protein
VPEAANQAALNGGETIMTTSELIAVAAATALSLALIAIHTLVVIL